MFGGKVGPCACSSLVMLRDKFGQNLYYCGRKSWGWVDKDWYRSRCSNDGTPVQALNLCTALQEPLLINESVSLGLIGGQWT